MSAVVKEFQYDGEHVLRGVIDIVCSFADGDTLLNMTKTCKSWRSAALREDKKRYYIRHFRLPNNTDNLASKLNVTPFVSLLIYQPQLEMLTALNCLEEPIVVDCFEKSLLLQFKKQLQNRTLVFMVEQYLTTEDVCFRGTKEQPFSKPIRHCDIMGLFLPVAKGRVDVRVTAFEDQEAKMYELLRRTPKKNDALIDRLTEELDLNNREHSQATILMLGIDGMSKFGLEIVRKICKKTSKKGREITFASLFGGKLMADNRAGDYLRNRTTETTVLLKISGPNVESWCSYVHYRAKRAEIEHKLDELKKQVKPKRHYIGLLYSRNCKWSGYNHTKHPCGNSYVMMRHLERVFPHIPFVGFFMDCYNDYNSHSQHPDRSSQCKFFNDEFFFQSLYMHTSIIIISYD